MPAPAKQAQTDSWPPRLCTRNLHHHRLPHRRRSYDHLRHLLYHRHRHRHRILSLPFATSHCRPPGQVSAHPQASPAVPRHRPRRRTRALESSTADGQSATTGSGRSTPSLPWGSTARMEGPRGEVCIIARRRARPHWAATVTARASDTDATPRNKRGLPGKEGASRVHQGERAPHGEDTRRAATGQLHQEERGVAGTGRTTQSRRPARAPWRAVRAVRRGRLGRARRLGDTTGYLGKEKRRGKAGRGEATRRPLSFLAW